MNTSTRFAVLLERFFTQRLMQQRQASAHTIASYRDTFKMLLQFAHKRLHKPPSSLSLQEIDAALVAAFLGDLEATRGITARTRNLRLTAIHSFFRFASYEAPDHAAQIERVLAIPAKKFDRALVSFLSRAEVDALLAAPDPHTWAGRRDHALMLLAVQTGLRLSELTGLHRDDVNKISYVLGSYRDFLDTRGRFPDLESGTWGGRGATALFGDLGVKGITKAHAIDRLLAHLGANRQDTVAFGDAAVDIPMLEYCAVGVAMGNGSEDIKAMAGIVAGDVEEDGLARAFERLGLM